MRFYHYTCQHSISAILSEGGKLRPNPQLGFQPEVRRQAEAIMGSDTDWAAYVFPVVWVTDVDIRSRDDAKLVGLGQLAGNLTRCQRVEFRFIVPNVGLMPWARWADANADPEIRAYLEAAEGAVPERWWVAPEPVAGARLDERYRGVRW